MKYAIEPSFEVRGAERAIFDGQYPAYNLTFNYDFKINFRLFHLVRGCVMGFRIASVIGLATIALAGCGEELIPQGDASIYTSKSVYGKRYKFRAVTTSDRNTTYWAHEISEGFVKPSDDHVPAEIVQRNVAGGCAMPKPASNAKIAAVIADGGYRIPMYLVARGARDRFQREQTLFGQSEALDKIANGSWARVIDVFVTETQASVYLVLGAYDTKLWNLNLAEGVELSGVTLVGYDVQSVAHLPEGVPVSFISYEGSSQGRCMKMPSRPVNDDWLAVERARKEKSSRGGFRYTLRKARKEYQEYRDWLQAKVGSPDSVITALDTSHVLVGPKPARPLHYRTTQGAQILYPTTARAIWGSRRTTNSKIADLVEANW
jgi:hypothetical protein